MSFLTPSVTLIVPEAAPETVSSEKFLEGLIAALRADGLQFIETRGNRHHRAFDGVAHRLQEHDAQNPDADLPIYIPTSISGVYLDWEAALLDWKSTLRLIPDFLFHNGVTIDCPVESATRILETIIHQRTLLEELAKIYRR